MTRAAVRVSQPGRKLKRMLGVWLSPRSADHQLQTLRPVAEGRGLGSASRSGLRGLRRRYRDDRLHPCPRASARRHGKKGDLDDAAWDVPAAVSPANSTRSSTRTGVPSPSVRPVARIADRTEAEALIDDIGEGDIPPADKGYEYQRDPRQSRRAESLSRHSTQGQSQGNLRLLRPGLSAAKLGRAFLQPDQTVPRHRHPPRQRSQQLSGRR